MTPSHRLPEPDRPWMMRTYSGHSSAEASNALYRSNLAKGQTGLSVAFDLPTQTGYDPDHELARGEVGKVGVPVAHRGDMATSSPPRITASTRRRSRARRRTTSSRSSSPAGPTRSRPARRCG
jgi:hypothetical protein